MSEDAALPQHVRDDAVIVKRNIDHQTRLIDDLLDLSRIENGKLVLQSQPVDVHAVLDEAIRMCRAGASERSISIAARFDARNHVVMGDAMRLRQVFCNLLKNAIKFSPDRGHVDATTQDLPDRRVKVCIRDDGIGIPPEALPRIFNAFDQGARSRERGHADGLGLGLAICKGIVDALGGSLTAHSDGVQRGAELHVDLHTTAHTGEDLKLSDPQAPAPLTGPVRILLVDDHADTLRLMARLLRRLEHRVVTAASVNEAMVASQSQQFDLLISDIGLPDGTGHELLQALQKKCQIRGIALTGYGMEEDLRKTRDAGFSAHLTKPIDFHALEQTIQDVVVTPATD